MSRKFTPYELNQLRQYGLQDIDVNSVGETPVEYLTGHCQFAQNDFLVTSDTLIPRIETEEILSLTSDFLTNHTTPINIVDIGTGTGCLGISQAIKLESQNIHNYNLFLVDISPSALKVAQHNSLRLLPNSQSKIKLLQSNLLRSFPNNVKTDLVLANLPYIPSSRIDTLDSSVKNYEPHLALDGGSTGTDLINQLIGELQLFCSHHFLAILEIDETHQLQDFNLPHHFASKVLTDQFNRNRFLILTCNNS